MVRLREFVLRAQGDPACGERVTVLLPAALSPGARPLVFGLKTVVGPLLDAEIRLSPGGAAGPRVQRGTHWRSVRVVEPHGPPAPQPSPQQKQAAFPILSLPEAPAPVHGRAGLTPKSSYLCAAHCPVRRHPEAKSHRPCPLDGARIDPLSSSPAPQCGDPPALPPFPLDRGVGGVLWSGWGTGVLMPGPSLQSALKEVAAPCRPWADGCAFAGAAGHLHWGPALPAPLHTRLQPPQTLLRGIRRGPGAGI